jgi:hypothetical protein
MTPSETVKLTRLVKAVCPHQAMDEFTSDAWHGILGDLPLDDCQTAVRIIAGEQRYIAPCDIRATVRQIRNERMARAKIPAPPPEVANGDPAAYVAHLHAARVAAADGRDPQMAMDALTQPPRLQIEAPND